MDIQIRKIYPNELQKFSESREYLNFEHLPLSKKRIASYLNNPRKNNNFPVLYLGFSEGKLIVFRSVLQDILHISSMNSISAAWLSGVWTHPDFRRRGFANKLLEQVCIDYSGQILSTNLALNTQNLMDNHPFFVNINPLDGHRFYFRFALEEILPPKSKFLKQIKPILKFVDQFGNFFLGGFTKSFKNVEFPEIQSAELTEDLEEFISKHNQNSLFKRNIEEFKWMRYFPWVEEREKDDELDKRYHFTTSAMRFQSHMKVLKENNQIKGFLFYTIKNEMMKVHYIFTESDIEREIFSRFLLGEIRKQKVSYLLMTDDKLIQFFKKSGGFIYSKIWKKGFFVGKKLLEEFPEITEKNIYMGDGDTAFT